LKLQVNKFEDQVKATQSLSIYHKAEIEIIKHPSERLFDLFVYLFIHKLYHL